MIGSFTQGHWLPMMTPATILGGVGWVHLDDVSASFFRFAREVLKELRPRRIRNAFCQAMIVEHPIDMQILNTDGPERVDDFTTVLVREIVAFPFGSFVDTSDHLAMPTLLFRSPLQFGVFALHLRQCLFFTAKEARIRNFLARGEGGKGFESYVNANGVRIVLQELRVALNGKGDIPFPSRGAMNGARLDRAFDRTVKDHLDGANLGEAHPIIMGETKTALRIGETIVATIPFKARIAGFLPRFTALEKGFEGQIDTHCNILQDLGMNLCERGALLFQNRIDLLLLETRERNVLTLVGRGTQVQQLIIQDATLFEMRFKRSLLFLCRIDPTLKVFKHRSILYLNERGVKKTPKCPIPSHHHKEGPFIPT